MSLPRFTAPEATAPSCTTSGKRSASRRASARSSAKPPVPGAVASGTVKRGRLIDYGIVAVVAIALALLVQAFLVKPYRIPSESMASTLRPGDRVLVNRVVYHLREPQRGDVMVFRYPEDRDVVFIKRIVGVPGDTLQVRVGRLWVNGRPTRTC